MQSRLQQAIALANNLPPDAQDNLTNTIFQEIRQPSKPAPPSTTNAPRTSATRF